MTITIAINTDAINNLELSPGSTVIEKLLQEGIISYEQQLRFEINYALEPGDPRELSEIPEVRLWFVRLDAKYPWLPFFTRLESRGISPLYGDACTTPVQFPGGYSV